MNRIEPVPAPIIALIDALNAGDTEAFVAAFTPDGTIDDWGRILTGADGIRSWIETDAIGMGAQMGVLHSTTQGDTTELEFAWASRKFTGTSTAIVTVDGDLVRSFRILPVH